MLGRFPSALHVEHVELLDCMTADWKTSNMILHKSWRSMEPLTGILEDGN